MRGGGGTLICEEREAKLLSEVTQLMSGRVRILHHTAHITDLGI